MDVRACTRLCRQAQACGSGVRSAKSAFRTPVSAFGQCETLHKSRNDYSKDVLRQGIKWVIVLLQQKRVIWLRKLIGCDMEIRVVEEKGRAQIEVTILSGPDDPRVSGIVRQLQMVDGKMTGYVPGTINRRVVFLADVAWIQTDGKTTLIHLVNGETLESSSRLAELEDALKDTAFVRTSRQELVNLDQVAGIKPAGSGRMLLSLGEKTLVASRKYAAEIKRRIGIV